ncbi:MAG: hypothetical protein GY861_02420 [bacterium]|nr:hypothetical protein [bacterium]
MLFTKKQASEFDYSSLDFTKPTFYHTSEGLDLILVGGWLYSERGLYAKDSSRLDGYLQEY